MSDYYNRETGWDALCRIMAEREAKEKEEESEVQNGCTTIPTDSHRNRSDIYLGSAADTGDDPVERNEQMKTEEDYIAEELKAEHEEEERKISEQEEERIVFGVKL